MLNSQTVLQHTFHKLSKGFQDNFTLSSLTNLYNYIKIILDKILFYKTSYMLNIITQYNNIFNYIITESCCTT